MRMEGNRPEAAAVTGDGWSFQCAASSMKIDRTIRGGGGKGGGENENWEVGRERNSVEGIRKSGVRMRINWNTNGLRDVGCGAVRRGAARMESDDSTRLDLTR